MERRNLLGFHVRRSPFATSWTPLGRLIFSTTSLEVCPVGRSRLEAVCFFGSLARVWAMAASPAMLTPWTPSAPSASSAPALPVLLLIGEGIFCPVW